VGNAAGLIGEGISNGNSLTEIKKSEIQSPPVGPKPDFGSNSPRMINPPF
jgi:hypothetical protein